MSFGKEWKVAMESIDSFILFTFQSKEYEKILSFEFFIFRFVHFFFSFVVLVPLFWRIEIKSVGLPNCSLICLS